MTVEYILQVYGFEMTKKDFYRWILEHPKDNLYSSLKIT